MKTYDLPCMDSRKSFYGKARVLEASDGSKYLQSYNTIVASIDPAGKFRRHWHGETQTTIRHVNSFCQFFGIDGGGIKFWKSQDVIPVTMEVAMRIA